MIKGIRPCARNSKKKGKPICSKLRQNVVGKYHLRSNRCILQRESCFQKNLTGHAGRSIKQNQNKFESKKTRQIE